MKPLEKSSTILPNMADLSWELFDTPGRKSKKYLYKFLSLKNYEKFIDSGKIWFSRSDTFGDKMECVFIKDLKQNPPNFDAIETRKKKNLISCWHEANTEILAFWDTYSKDDNDRRVVAIRFKKESLISHMKNSLVNNNLPGSCNKIIHGNVRYKSLLSGKYDYLATKKVKYPSFRKEYTFRYEQEYRFVMRLNKEYEKAGKGYLIGDSKKLNFNILLNPLLDIETYTQLKNEIKGRMPKKFKESELAKWLKPELWSITT